MVIARAKRDDLQAILDALPMLVMHVDANERFTCSNAAFEPWFGHSTREIEGMKIAEVIGETAYTAGYDEIQRALAGELSIFHNISYDDGGERCVRGTLIPDIRVQGKANGFFAVVEDVTEERGIERELARHREQLEGIVEERTADLRAANRQLEQHMLERAEIELSRNPQWLLQLIFDAAQPEGQD